MSTSITTHAVTSIIVKKKEISGFGRVSTFTNLSVSVVDENGTVTEFNAFLKPGCVLDGFDDIRDTKHLYSDEE